MFLSIYLTDSMGLIKKSDARSELSCVSPGSVYVTLLRNVFGFPVGKQE